MRAKDVLSPISKTRNHNVLFESPASWGEPWSLVEAEVTEDGEEWNSCLGLRWDGDRNDPDAKGFPNSSGKAVWMWMPEDLLPFFYGMIIPQLTQRKKSERHNRNMANKIDEILALLSKTKPAPTKG